MREASIFSSDSGLETFSKHVDLFPSSLVLPPADVLCLVSVDWADEVMMVHMLLLNAH